MATVTLSGFKELDAALGELGKSVQKPVLRRALLKAAKPMADIARGMAPDDPNTGGFDLRKSIIAGTKLSHAQKRQHRKMHKDDKAAVEVYVGAGPLPHAHFQEFGTVNHAPQPFMRPAFDQDVMPLLDRLKKELASEIEKAAARAARKAARG